MEGFIILDFIPEYPEGIKQLATWLSQGKIKGKNTIVKGGIEKAEYALNDLFNGLNTGRSPLFDIENMAWHFLTWICIGKLVVEVKEQ